jgi:hypothetical protein
VNDGATDEVSDNFFTVTNIKQVKVKKFSTTGVDYTVQFTDTFAHLEFSQFHDRLHGIFESLLDSITRDVPEHDQVNIVSKEHQNSIIFSGPDKDKRIYLFLHDNHFDVITSMPAFFARKMCCHTCKKGYDHVKNHLCGDTCKLCYFQNCRLFRGFHVVIVNL